MELKKILVIIPTRNRSDFAINAVNSVLSQEIPAVELLLSDNSTDDQHIKTLSHFCMQIGEDRLSYIRPPKSLSMTDHWDWIMGEVLKLSSASHFAFLSDRSIFLKNALKTLEKVVNHYPSEVISYLGNEIYDDINPVMLSQFSWSGKIYEVKSSHMLQTLASRMTPTFSTPRMSNCCVPRNVFQAIKSNFGRYFSSIAPDYNFAFSFSSIFESVFYYDIPLNVSYGMDRSNGNNSSRGRFQKDVKDFQSNIDSKFKISFNSPIESILPFINAVLHEYFIIKNSDGRKTRFPEINEWLYHRALMQAVLALENDKLRNISLTQFYKNLGVKAAGFHLRAKFPIKKWLTNPLAQKNSAEDAEPFILKTAFQNTDEAIKYDNDFPRKPLDNPAHLSIKLGVGEPDNQNVKLIN